MLATMSTNVYPERSIVGFGMIVGKVMYKFIVFLNGERHFGLFQCAYLRFEVEPISQLLNTLRAPQEKLSLQVMFLSVFQYAEGYNECRHDYVRDHQVRLEIAKAFKRINC